MSQGQKYYYLSNGQPVGPLTYEELKELFRLGTVHRGTFILLETEKQWKLLSHNEPLIRRIKDELGADHLPAAPQTSPEFSSNYFVGIPGEKAQGPLSAKQINEGIKTKKFGRSHFIFDQFVNEWVPLFTHPDFDRRRVTRLTDGVSPAGETVPIPKRILLQKKIINGVVTLCVVGGLAAFIFSSPVILCKLGSGNSCQEHGVQLIGENKTQEAIKYFEKSCQLGSPAGCHDSGMAKLVLKDPTQAASYFKNACNKKFGPSCFQVAKSLKPGSDEQLEAYSRACDWGSGEACVVLGESDLNSKQMLRAEKLFKRSCELKYAPGCNRLSLFALDSGNKVLALSTLETSCGLNNADGCAGLGQHQYESGNHNLASEYLAKACQLGSGLGCGGAANLAFLSGNESSGERLALKACDLSDPIGCGLLGSYYLESGKRGEAKTYLSKACHLNSGLSCHLAAGVFKADRAPASEVKALQAKACQLNSKYCVK